ncbi:transmembrane amino acid transporter protein-domain-containing protein [Aspergillus parasiticus]|uniref:Transmembrane amino acid transporter protein-domain-containing protein n=1 Tax=Aspergillus parasiticus TaxID=5067 RepID=A0A5N6DEU9_ASPPA|nr:transmembrane amino acid transporter protein-domain-containing protein [Aspergillus parasiticus]
MVHSGDIFWKTGRTTKPKPLWYPTKFPHLSLFTKTLYAHLCLQVYTPVIMEGDKKKDQYENDQIIDQVDSTRGYMEPIKDEMTASRLQDPFAGEEGSQVQYRIMKWWHCAILMIAQSISLGVLSLPSSMATLGFVPGCILILVLGALTTYTGYVLGQFKLCHPHIHNMSDAAEVLFGAWGREIATAAQILFFIFLMGAHILTFSIMMNTLTNHGACTLIFGLVGAILCFVLTLSRRLQEVSYLGWISSLSIFASVLITIVGVGIDSPNAKGYAINHPSLLSGFSACLNIVISFAGHLAFFSFQSELAEPKDFTKALITLQVTDTSLYLVTAVVIYYYTGAEVKSPALLSASPVVSKVAFGIAIGTIVIAGVIIAHVGAKTIYVRLFRGTNRMNEYSLVSYGSWVLIVLILWTIAWIIASAIPVFNDLLSLLAAAFGSWFSFGLEGLFWLHMNRGKLASKRKVALAILNFFLVLIACLICGMGLWATAKDISSSAKNAHGAFSCADNR